MQGFLICYNYDDIAYPLVYTSIDEARKFRDEHFRDAIIRVVTIKLESNNKS